MTGHACALQHAPWGGARTNRTRSTRAIRLAVRPRAAPKAVTLHDALEALTFRGTDNVNRFAVSKETNIELGTQLNVADLGALLQVHFPQYAERAKLRARTTLAILLHFKQLTNLLALFRLALLFLLVFTLTRGTLLLLVRLKSPALPS